MTYERDYILRMVREFSTFPARIVRSKDGGREEPAIADLDQTARAFGANLNDAHRDAVRTITDHLVARTDEPADRMAGIRIALRGASPMLYGRLAPVLEGAVLGK